MFLPPPPFFKIILTSHKVEPDKSSRMGFLKMRDIVAYLFTNRYDAIKRKFYDADRGCNSRSKAPDYRKRTGSR